MCIRDSHNVVRLMERFPAFHFVQSQAQLYEFVRRDYPALFQEIAGCVAEGRWEPVGGMWVEADCNVTGPESLARQFLLGTGYFRQHFGDRGETPVLWLPDVFGFPWSLPQLAREAGQRYFFSTKMGWSQYNRFPYDSFWWQGLDGSRLLAHFSPSREGEYSFAGTYNALATPETVLNTWGDFQQKDWGRPGEAPPLLLWVMPNELRMLARVRGVTRGGRAPHPAKQRELERIARRHTHASLLALLLQAAEIDRMIKGLNPHDPWDALAELALQIRNDFRRYACGHPALHISGGLVLVTPHYPLYQAAQEAGRAEDDAKARPGKDACPFLGRLLPWSDVLRAHEWALRLAGQRQAGQAIGDQVDPQDLQRQEGQGPALIHI